MNEERAKRKLSAILSADVKGYSRLMGDDELGTVNRLKEYRQVMTSHIKTFGGRVVDAPGDNLLSEFTSVVDALECAVELQRELKKRNDTLPSEKKMEFRIGVNLGDVIEDGNRIYGDGVNVAARIEALADASGICISGTAYDQIGKKLPFGYEYLGEQTVKNIEKPVRVYRVLTDPETAGKVIGEKRFLGMISRRAAMAAIIVLVIVVFGLIGWNIYLHQSKKVEVASLEKMAYPLPDKPSIAVLPFDNLSGDPKQEYLSDGLSEEIISGLSRVPRLFVIARNSSFVYKDKPVKIKQVSEELGVRYVLEGSVRKQGNRIRVTAQLIDAVKGYHVWSERYDRDLNNIFEVQDGITKRIITAMQVELTEGELAAVWAKGTENLEAYFKVIQGREQLGRFNNEGTLLAKPFFEEAIALDPQYAFAYALLANAYMLELWFGSSKAPKQSAKRAMELAQKAIKLDESMAEPRAVLSFIYLMIRQYDKAIAAAEMAVSLDPNSPNGYAFLGFSLNVVGRHEEAIPEFEMAIRLNPRGQSWYFHNLGWAYREMGQYEKAIEALDKAIRMQPGNLVAHILRVTTYSYAGRDEEARSAAAKVLQIDPKFSLEQYAKTSLMEDRAAKERSIQALRKAGLK